jgi:hypothetical protein
MRKKLRPAGEDGGHSPPLQVVSIQSWLNSLRFAALGNAAYKSVASLPLGTFAFKKQNTTRIGDGTSIVERV